MPASPMKSIETEEGVTLTLRCNEWIYRPDKGRFAPVSRIGVGHQVQYERPDGPVLTVKATAILPYKNAKD